MLLEHSGPDTLTPLGDGRRSPGEGSIPRIQNSEKRQKYLDISYFLWYSMNREEASQMKAGDAIKKVMEEQGVRVSQIAYMTGKKSNVISERLSQENISVGKMLEMLRVLEYKVVIMPRDAKMQDGWYEVE